MRSILDRDEWKTATSSVSPDGATQLMLLSETRVARISFTLTSTVSSFCVFQKTQFSDLEYETVIQSEGSHFHLASKRKHCKKEDTKVQNEVKRSNKLSIDKKDDKKQETEVSFEVKKSFDNTGNVELKSIVLFTESTDQAQKVQFAICGDFLCCKIG